MTDERRTSPRRVDASMTLLIETMRRPLDPGYAAAAARRAEQGPRSRRRQAPLTLVLAAVGGALLLVAVLALRLPDSADTGARLRDQVQARTAAVDTAQERVTDLQAEIDALQDARLQGAGSALVDQVRTLGVLAGTTAVTGPGVVHTLDDSADSDDPVSGDPRAGEAAQQGRVVARDVQVVVNGLWAAGAEAIAVNGHRLTSTAAIRQAGDAVIVDFRPLARPYVIEAVGDRDTLQTRFAAGVAGSYVQQVVQNYGVRADVTTADDLQLPGGGGQALRYATDPAADPATDPATDPEGPP